MKETNSMVPVLNIITIGDISVQSNKDGSAELLDTMRTLLADESVQVYVDKLKQEKVIPPYTQ